MFCIHYSNLWPQPFSTFQKRRPTILLGQFQRATNAHQQSITIRLLLVGRKNKNFGYACVDSKNKRPLPRQMGRKSFSTLCKTVKCRPGLRIKCKQIRIIFSLVHRPYKKGTSWLTQSCEKSATLLAKNKASAKGKKHTAVDRQVEIMCIAFTWYTNMGFDKGAWPAMRNSKVMMTMMNFCLLAGFKFEFAKCKWPGKRWGWAEGGISCAVELVQSRWGACLKRDSHSATKAEVKNVILASS